MGSGSRIIFCLLISFPFRLFAEDSVDLGSIEQRFVEIGVKEERHHITNADQWRYFWLRFSSPPVPRPVDFEKNDLVLYLMGTKSSGGYVTRIESIVKNSVHILLCHPDPDGMQSAELTSPYAAKVIPKIRGPILWKFRKQVTGQKDCQ
jgi:hypothetical protein